MNSLTQTNPLGTFGLLTNTTIFQESSGVFSTSRHGEDISVVHSSSALGVSDGRSRFSERNNVSSNLASTLPISPLQANAPPTRLMTTLDASCIIPGIPQSLQFDFLLLRQTPPRSAWVAAGQKSTDSRGPMDTSASVGNWGHGSSTQDLGAALALAQETLRRSAGAQG